MNNKQNIILGGDFNLVLDINLDKIGGNPITHLRALSVVKDFMSEANLVDIWRIKNPTKYTWQRENVKVCLDFFLVSKNLMQFIEETEIIDSYGKSDHLFPYFKAQFSSNPRGKGVWKFNTSLLCDKEYISAINNIIEENISKEYKSQAHKWEVIKMLMRSETIKISVARAKQRTEKLERIETQLNNLNEASSQPLSQAQLNLRQDLIKERDEIL